MVNAVVAAAAADDGGMFVEDDDMWMDDFLCLCSKRACSAAMAEDFQQIG